MPDAEIYMAVADFIDMEHPNVPVPVRRHATARAGHPIIKRHPTMWVPIEVDYELESKVKPQTGRRATGG